MVKEEKKIKPRAEEIRLPGEKEYEKLTFTDNFLFCKIMEKNPRLCKQLLETILNVKIRKLVFAGREEAIGVTPQGKSIRLDVYVEDGEGTVYDIEMQVSEKKNLPKRLRYYQGMIDLNMIEKGADYSELRKSFVIFICTFDFFGKELPVYTFTNRCRELPELELGDGAEKVFVNPYGNMEGLSDDMRAFLKYLKGELTEENSLVNEIDREVADARNHREWRVEYMTLMMEYREKYKEGERRGERRGERKGERKGVEKGIEAFVLDSIEEYVPEERVVEKLQRRFGLSEKKSRQYYDKYARKG